MVFDGSSWFLQRVFTVVFTVFFTVVLVVKSSKPL